METREHTALGKALRFINFGANPYIRRDAKGVLYLRLQRIGPQGLLETMDLEMSAGEIIAMAGDYFTQKDWYMRLNLPNFRNFNPGARNNGNAYVDLGRYLIEQPIENAELDALILAYNNLAAPDVHREDIDKIYKIDGANYLPLTPTLNEYFKQLMFYLRVKNYGEMLDRNQTHFTPWSVRVYTLGHNLALKYANFAYELKQLSLNPNYQLSNQELLSLVQNIANQDPNYSPATLQDLAYRYEALALEMELFTFHYYSDHFAAGHMSMVGDLRVLLTERFGTLGSILVNNLHNELNRVGVYTKRPYDPTPDENEPPILAHGDGDFDNCTNHLNRANCLEGMHSSLEDISKVLAGAPMPEQWQYGGLEHLPDADPNYRQYQPLLFLSGEGKIFCRKELSKIKLLSPSDYDALRAAPQEQGYYELKSKWDVFKLVAKLRVLPFIYEGTIQAPTVEELARIEEDERQRLPNRRPMPIPSCSHSTIPSSSASREPLIPWQKPANSSSLHAGLNRNSLLATNERSRKSKNREKEEKVEMII